MLSADMLPIRNAVSGPWRAVPVLGLTQILAWGALFYPPVLIMPLIAGDRGWSVTFAMGGFSLSLLVAGLVAPRVGALIDRHGGHRVMPIGALVGALGLVGLVGATSMTAYLGVCVALGVALASSLYDPAFATLGRIFGARSRQPITALTLAGGFASTVSWPATHLLIEAVGWRGTYLVYAGLLAIVAAPLLFLALPRDRAEPEIRLAGTSAASLAPPAARGRDFLLVVAAFAAYAFVPSALAAHLLAIFNRLGLDQGTVVTIGALFGPAQVAARSCELLFARHLHPLPVARAAVWCLVLAFVPLAAFGVSVPVAAGFAIAFGAANGLITIARGTVPLALFGARGYGRLIGRIAGPSLLMQSAAPLVLAFIAERGSDALALAVTAGFAVIALGCFAAIRRP